MFVNAQQFENAHSPMSFTLLEIVIFSPQQPSNALSPMFITPS